MISLAEDGAFAKPEPVPVTVRVLIGAVYRLRVIKIPLYPGLEVFPTVEVIDRLYTPLAEQRRFPIIIELTAEDLRLALEGKFVTRVIYLEDPQTALPVGEEVGGDGWFDVGPRVDPLAVADQLGRPVAILRMGGRLPETRGPTVDFLFGCPPVQRYPPEPKTQAPLEQAPAEAAKVAVQNPQRLQQ